ncbi:MAG: T9SS type A sorting domain-containing protein [bacterium]|nr:T9SS type A sorting domain-containing protein [bacterium]
MKKLWLCCCMLMVFALAAWAAEGTVDSAPKTDAQKVEKKALSSLDADLARVAERKAAREAELNAMFPRHTPAPAPEAASKKEPVRDPNRGLDDPIGSCCYSYGPGYYDCWPDVTEFECLELNAGLQWNEGMDCSVCPTTQYGSCCYEYFGYYTCYTNLSEEDCYLNYLGQTWTADGTCDSSCLTVYGRCCYMNDGYCYDYSSQVECDYWGGVWAEGLACQDEPLCFPVGRCCYDFPPYCSDNITEMDCFNYYGGGGEGLGGRAPGSLDDPIWTEGATCADEPTCIPPTGRCCYDYDGQYCTDVTEYECLNYYWLGVWTEGANCNDGCPVLPTGRCCYNNPPYCTDNITQAGCGYQFAGTWTEGMTCETEPLCPLPTGRCCYGVPANPSCSDVTEADCAQLGGQWAVNFTCENPCPIIANALRVITVPVPHWLGVCISADCRGDLYYTNYGLGVLHKMNEFGALLSSNSIVDASGNARYIDEMGWDEGRQVFWGGELNTNAIWTIDRDGLATYQFPGMGGYGLTDGLDFDPTDGTVWHSTDVSSVVTHFSSTGLLLGTLTLLDEFNNPEGSISGVEMGANNTIWAGDSPIDDIRRCDKVTGAFVSRFDAGQVRCEGMECDAINFAPQTVLWVKDAYNNTVTAFEIEAGTCVCSELPDTCEFPYQEVDHGDLSACNYPTLVNNPAHALSGIAWLGPMVDGEVAPQALNQDQLPEDDGVFFVDLPWNPCQWETLRVAVTGGQEYGRFAECGGRLYLNAWKDGNLDGDFCDEIPCQDVPPIINASEWIVQDMLVTPGSYDIPVLDPGVLDMGRYDGVFRFRLTSTPVGRYGFGLAVSAACTDQCGTFAFDILGEVEDYIVADGQLDVELAQFGLVPGNRNVTVNWQTASETDNHHFLIQRDGQAVAEVATLGNTASGHEYTWTDGQLTNGTEYTYSLIAVDVNGAQEVLATQSATPRSEAGVITEYALHQNYPNPFNPTTTIRFDLVEGGFTSLRVYNIQGREVATLINSVQSAGAHTVNFDAAGLPSGLYIYRLEANGYSAEHKMLLLK